MHKHPFVLAALAVGLAACGSGPGGSGDTLREGAFVFPVAGLAYATPSESGVTDASGTYRYREGETISFSVGGIALGSATGAPTISPFDLVGIAAPATSQAVRAELQNPLDVTAFDRAANIAFFLASLDADGDLANGVDATGWDAALADASLRFEAPLLEFPERGMRRLAARYDIRRTVLLEAPLAGLYRALGIAIAAHLPTVSSYDLAGDGVDDFTTTHTYDAAGRRTRESVANADPSQPDEIYETEYDADGRMVRRTNFVGDRETYREILTHDTLGRVVLQEHTAFETDGSVHDTWAYETGYDTHGNRVSEVFTRMGVRTRMSTYTYDAFGEQLAYTIVYDGSDRTETYAAEYDAEGRVLHEEEIAINGASYDRKENRFTYDVEGRLARVVETDHDDMDKIVDDREETTYTYDAEGATSVTLQDDDADGVVDARYTYRRRADGRPESSLEEYFDPTTGVLVEARRNTITYDAYGTELTSVNSTDPDGAGPLPFELDSDYLITTTYDVHGNVTEQRTLDQVSGYMAIARATYQALADGIGALVKHASLYGAS